MPIDSDPDTPDRARENPAAPETPGSPESRDGPEAAAFRQQQIAEHVRYQCVADAAYQAAARQTWAKAVPDLRAAWEEHRKKFPERTRPTPHTQPDGGWVADGNRRLTPGQNAEVTKACADLRDEADQVLLPAMLRVEAASPGGRLAGLDHMLKGENRLKEKIADELLAKPGKTVRQAISEVADPVRFTLSYPPQRYGTLISTRESKASGAGPTPARASRIQFHTPESLEAKELTHPAYERIRGSDASPAERRELKAFQLRVNALQVDPPATAVIMDFPEKKRG